MKTKQTPNKTNMSAQSIMGKMFGRHIYFRVSAGSAAAFKIMITAQSRGTHTVADRGFLLNLLHVLLNSALYFMYTKYNKV